MIDAINDMCHSYGIQMRRLYLGGYFRPDGSFHFDGASPRSVMDAIRWDRDGAGQGPVIRHYAENLTGDALLVRRAQEGLSEDRLYLLRLHYVLPRRQFPVKQKIAAMESLWPAKYSGKHDYYDSLDRLHEWINARVPHGTESYDLVGT